MPPRKRARISEATSPTQTQTLDQVTKPTDDNILNDPWTDEEEIGLFKGLLKWKPTGIHKHFRMLQLREYLLENGYIHHRSRHTDIAGIWQKLESLYDLEALDQREDARQLSDLSAEQSSDEQEVEQDAYNVAANKIHKKAFDLPSEEYGDQTWKRRFADEQERRDESPPLMPGLNMNDRAPVRFTPSFSIEPEEVTTPAPPRGRPSRGSARTKAVVPAAATARRSRRKPDSVATASEEPGSEVAASAEQEASEQDSGSNGGDEDNDEEEASQTSGPATRGRGRGRGRGAGRGRARVRKR